MNRLRMTNGIRHHIVLALPHIAHRIGRRGSSRHHIVIGPLGSHLDKSLKVVLVVVVIFDNKFFFPTQFRLRLVLIPDIHVIAIRILVLGILIIEQRIVFQFLVEPLLQSHGVKLQDLHRPDHVRRHYVLLRHLHLWRQIQMHDWVFRVFG